MGVRKIEIRFIKWGIKRLIEVIWDGYRVKRIEYGFGNKKVDKIIRKFDERNERIVRLKDILIWKRKSNFDRKNKQIKRRWRSYEWGIIKEFGWNAKQSKGVGKLNKRILRKR